MRTLKTLEEALKILRYKKAFINGKLVRILSFWGDCGTNLGPFPTQGRKGKQIFILSQGALVVGLGVFAPPIWCLGLGVKGSRHGQVLSRPHAQGSQTRFYESGNVARSPELEDLEAQSKQLNAKEQASNSSGITPVDEELTASWSRWRKGLMDRNGSSKSVIMKGASGSFKSNVFPLARGGTAQTVLRARSEKYDSAGDADYIGTRSLESTSPSQFGPSQFGTLTYDELTGAKHMVLSSTAKGRRGPGIHPGNVMPSILRKLVSKKKKRYVHNGFSLDLAYIIPQVRFNPTWLISVGNQDRTHAFRIRCRVKRVSHFDVMIPSDPCPMQWSHKASCVHAL